jgi:hypothetical protein
MSNYVPPTTPIGQPQKKSNALTYILIGCGSITIIGVIVVVLGGYFVWNKAKQAGLDPELMQKKPALAAAKMMVAANPDIELVSVDDEKGLITVRDKKTGETVTVNLDDAQKGKVTFKKNGEDEVSIEAKGDEANGSVEVKSGEGTAKFGAGSVDKIPDWVPLYPDAQPIGSYSAQNKDGWSGGFHFATKDSPNKVISFYEDGFKRAGLTANTNLLTQNGKTTGGLATGEDTGKKRNVSVNAIADEDGTQVTVIYEMKP